MLYLRQYIGYLFTRVYLKDRGQKMGEKFQLKRCIYEIRIYHKIGMICEVVRNSLRHH